jgi:hypothetical protein
MTRCRSGFGTVRDTLSDTLDDTPSVPFRGYRENGVIGVQLLTQKNPATRVPIPAGGGWSYCRDV